MDATIRFGKIHIIEWLAPGDLKTGWELFDELQPIAFVDDYLPYMRGVPDHVHTALVLRAPNGSPNTGPDIKLAKSLHPDLASFADHWLTR